MTTHDEINVSIFTIIILPSGNKIEIFNCTHISYTYVYENEHEYSST